MKKILNEIEEYFYKLFYEDSPVSTFEKWIYNSSDIKDLLSEDDYLNLISLNFKNNSSNYEIEKIIRQYINFGKFEAKKILMMLYHALTSRKDLPIILQEFYHMYCYGYDFFNDLGLGYGLICEVPPDNYNAETWDELTEEHKNEIITSFYPQIENDIKRAIDWLESEKIILTGIKDDLDNYEYIDKRSKQEKNLHFG